MDELTLLKAAHSATPDNRDLARLYAAKLAEAGRWHEVCAVLEPLAVQQEDWLLLELGIAHLETGNPYLAVCFLENLTSAHDMSDTMLLKLYPALIRALLENGQPKEAENMLADMLEKLPGYDPEPMLSLFERHGIKPRIRVKQHNADRLEELSDFTPLLPGDRTITFSDVGGMDELKRPPG